MIGVTGELGSCGADDDGVFGEMSGRHVQYTVNIHYLPSTRIDENGYRISRHAESE